MIKFSDEVKARVAEHHNPHCLVWVKAVASLWGVADDHDLDEPVQLTTGAPVRVRHQVRDGALLAIMDRTLTMETLRSGRHAALRFTFSNGRFHEIEINGLGDIHTDCKTVEVKP